MTNALRGILPIVLLVGFLTCTGAAFGETIDDKIRRLERIIEMQQQQIDRQSQQIDRLQQQVEGLGPAHPAAPSAPPAAASAPVASGEPKGLITSRNDMVEVELYGQVNRALLYADDGDKSKLYQVDNDNSSTRIGLNGAISPWEEWKLGTRIEVEYQSNASNLVNRENPNTSGDNFVDRHIEVFILSERFGKLSIGQGDTASNETSEVDLSGTAVAGYSDIPLMAGGQLFFDAAAETLTGAKISDVFNNFDGLSRKDRLRYDTPIWHGWQGAASAVSGSGGDLALRYNRKFEGVKVAIAGAYSDPGSESRTVDESWNGSASILHRSGLNLTLAGGTQDLKMSGREDPLFFYAKAGYRKTFFAFGETAFSIDYGFNEDVARDGDEARAAGVQFVQNIDRWAADLFLIYRNHDLDRPGVDLEAIDAVLSGVRVKF